jgi:hypothetical protein
LETAWSRVFIGLAETAEKGPSATFIQATHTQHQDARPVPLSFSIDLGSGRDCSNISRASDV